MSVFVVDRIHLWLQIFLLSFNSFNLFSKNSLFWKKKTFLHRFGAALNSLHPTTSPSLFACVGCIKSLYCRISAEELGSRREHQIKCLHQWPVEVPRWWQSSVDVNKDTDEWYVKGTPPPSITTTTTI